MKGKVIEPTNMKMSNTIFKSKEVKPLNIIIWKPNNEHNEDIYNKYIKPGLKKIMPLKEIQPKTFQRVVNFTTEERLIYVPPIEGCRVDMKKYFDNKWFEKEDIHIDPTHFIMDVFYYKDHIIIRNVFQPQFSTVASTRINQLLATVLSNYGTSYNLIFDRTKNVEFIQMIKNNIIKDERINSSGGQKPLDWFYMMTEINFGTLQMEMDKAIEIYKAPYDLKEYKKQLALFKKIPNMQINLDKDNINDTIENEQTVDIYKLEALIKSTEELMKEKVEYDIDSHYFKINEKTPQGVKNVR